MCDTMAARGKAVIGGATLFAKNSDRERNEAQYLQLLPAQQYGNGAVLRATYITIPQAARTHAVLLSRPYWIWGAEMGVNEHGVAIGNEAVHPRAKPQRRDALLGMDLLRLGLERSTTAAAAVEVITGLLEAHGQGGCCSITTRRWYDNSFIIADHREIYVLETMGRHWAVERAGDTRAISNTYTIGTDATRLSAGLEEFARAQGWASGNKFDFAAAVTDPANPGLPVAIARCTRATSLLARDHGNLTPAHMMRNLRDHGSETAPGWHPQDIVGGTICMHAADGIRRGQSVGSIVSDLRPDGAIHWLTGASAPCTAIFKPVILEHGLPAQGPRPGGAFDAKTLWWRHEALHRAALADYPAFIAAFGPERDALEADFATRLTSKKAIESCWKDAEALESRWLHRLQSRASLRPAYRTSWTRHDRLAGADLICAPVAMAAE